MSIIGIHAATGDHGHRKPKECQYYEPREETPLEEIKRLEHEAENADVIDLQDGRPPIPCTTTEAEIESVSADLIARYQTLQRESQRKIKQLTTAGIDTLDDLCRAKERVKNLEAVIKSMEARLHEAKTAQPYVVPVTSEEASIVFEDFSLKPQHRRGDFDEFLIIATVTVSGMRGYVQGFNVSEAVQSRIRKTIMGEQWIEGQVTEARGEKPTIVDMLRAIDDDSAVTFTDKIWPPDREADAFACVECSSSPAWCHHDGTPTGPVYNRCADCPPPGHVKAEIAGFKSDTKPWPPTDRNPDRLDIGCCDCPRGAIRPSWWSEYNTAYCAEHAPPGYATKTPDSIQVYGGDFGALKIGPGILDKPSAWAAFCAIMEHDLREAVGANLPPDSNPGEPQ